MKTIAVSILLLAVLSISLASTVGSLSFVYSSTENESSDSGEESSESNEAENQQQEEESKDDVPEPEPEPKTEEPPAQAQVCPPLCGPEEEVPPTPPATEEPILPVEPEPEPEQPDESCLFNPSQPKCASDNGICPDGFFQNEDGNCVPNHPNGCPEGFHSHEDDETGQCIPDSTPCEPGYTRDPDFPTCSSIDSVCRDHPDEDICNNNDNNGNNNGNHNHNKDKKDKVIKIITNIDIVNKINKASDGDNGDLDISQTIVAINYNEGAGINCVFDNDDNGQCETFDVTKDSGKEPLLQIIEFD